MSIRIIAKTANNQISQEFKKEPNDSVLSLKQEIANMLALNPSVISLFYKSKKLNDQATIIGSGIQDHDNVYIIKTNSQQQSSMKINLIIQKYDGNTFNIQIEPNKTILELKKEINNRTGVPFNAMNLTCGGKTMEDESDHQTLS
jgi:hypothetical protein